MCAAFTWRIPPWCNTLYCDKTLLIQLKPVNSNLLFSNSLLPLPVLPASSSQLSRSSSLSLTIFRTPLESWRWWNSNEFQCNQLVIDTWMKAWSIKNWCLNNVIITLNGRSLFPSEALFVTTTVRLKQYDIIFIPLAPIATNNSIACLLTAFLFAVRIKTFLQLRAFFPAWRNNFRLVRGQRWANRKAKIYSAIWL